MIGKRAGTLAAIALLAAGCGGGSREPAGVAFGKKGDPITLTVGYQPYYAESWSSLVIRKKQFWKKYLPKGSKVTFQAGLQGSVIVSQMLAGKQQIGYVGDMPAIVGASKRSIRDLRIVATLGLSQDQCAVFLVRPDAPAFSGQRESVEWMNGKTVATPQGSCADRIAQATLQRLGVKPKAYLDQPVDVIASSFEKHKLDAAIVWEPTATRLVNHGLAKRVASGAFVNERDASFMLMSARLLDERADVAEAWLKAELDAQRYLAGPANADEIAQIALKQTKGFDKQDLWDALYRKWPKDKGGSTDGVRIRLPFAINAQAREHIARATIFLHRIKAIKADRLPPGAVSSALAQKVLRDRGAEAGAGVIRALPRRVP